VNRTTVPLDLQELRLVAAAKAGDKLCYRELLARNQAAAFRAAHLSTGSSAEACAATQRAGIAAWTALRRFPATGRFGPWLALLAVFEISEAARKSLFAPPTGPGDQFAPLTWPDDQFASRTWRHGFGPRTAHRMRAELAMAARLERRVEELSVGVEFPVAPDVCAAVMSQLPERATPRSVSDPAQRTPASAPGQQGLVARARAGARGVAAVVVLAAAAAAVAISFGHRVPAGAPRAALGQVSLPVSSPAPSSLAALPSPLIAPGAAPDHHLLGERIPVTLARHAAGFTALLPPAPRAAYIGRDVSGGRISLLAGPELITEFRGTTIPYILTLIGPGSHAELTWVNGRPGVYSLGARTSGAGEVLTWLQGPLTLQIEGAQTLEDALALARSLR
jgi:DNA-directed RNA polymerase specialized sigma24 family protein